MKKWFLDRNIKGLYMALKRLLALKRWLSIGGSQTVALKHYRPLNGNSGLFRDDSYMKNFHFFLASRHRHQKNRLLNTSLGERPKGVL